MMKIILGLAALNSVILLIILKQNRKIMGTQQEQFDALIGRLDTITNDIADDYAALLKAAQDAGVSDESMQRAEANIARLEALGASVVNPVPDPGTGGDTGGGGTDTGG